jgi:hypothetical protein
MTEPRETAAPIAVYVINFCLFVSHSIYMRYPSDRRFSTDGDRSGESM